MHWCSMKTGCLRTVESLGEASQGEFCSLNKVATTETHAEDQNTVGWNLPVYEVSTLDGAA